MRALSITAALCCLMAAACAKNKSLEKDQLDWSGDVQKNAHRAVEDPVRAAAVGRTSEELSAEIALFYGEIGLIRKKFARLNADYGAKRSEFETVMNEFQAGRRARGEKLVKLAMEMRAQMTPEEWQKFAAMTKSPTE
jgi:hypothetical protein